MDFLKNRRLLSYTRKAVDEYKMIEEGDRIAVGISGGKDSIALFCTLAALKRFYPVNFELVGITIDTGFEGMDFSKVAELCADLEIEYHIIKTEIKQIIFDYRKESNPCSLCARMRRGALHDAAKEYSCNKIALGHHYDDVVETFILNLAYEGRLGTFSPVTYLSRKDLTMIRPFIYTAEKDIKYFISKNEWIPLVESTCPEDKKTQREEVKKFLAENEKLNKGLKHRIMGAIQKAGLDGFHE
ncbi:MAG: tRNA 2-thiocytidine(32) synthetase TtcA [Ruminococcaceae bacterium]|nr:tRNA 2-thiocytidine(32) synthetase TtcA [Oscillospiraceae bacterium]